MNARDSKPKAHRQPKTPKRLRRHQRNSETNFTPVKVENVQAGYLKLEPKIEMNEEPQQYFGSGSHQPKIQWPTMRNVQAGYCPIQPKIERGNPDQILPDPISYDYLVPTTSPPNKKPTDNFYWSNQYSDPNGNIDNKPKVFGQSVTRPFQSGDYRNPTPGTSGFSANVRQVHSEVNLSGSRAFGRGLEKATADKRASFTIDPIGSDGKRVQTELFPFVITLSRDYPISLTHRDDGKYLVSYTPTFTEPLEISITWKDTPILGSPSVVHVKPERFVYKQGDRPLFKSIHKHFGEAGTSRPTSHEVEVLRYNAERPNFNFAFPGTVNLGQVQPPNEDKVRNWLSGIQSFSSPQVKTECPPFGQDSHRKGALKASHKKVSKGASCSREMVHRPPTELGSSLSTPALLFGRNPSSFPDPSHGLLHRSQSEDTNENGQFKCLRCPRTFTSKLFRRAHYKKVHEVQETIANCLRVVYY